MNHVLNGKALRLGVNVDHVATIRNARGGGHPDPVRAALQAALAGADSIVAHLREDRRHVGDDDLDRLVARLAEQDLPLTLEMAATDEMLKIALRHGPSAACIVPERREERTTEGGLDATEGGRRLGDIVGALAGEGIKVSLFIEPDRRQLEAAGEIGAAAVELHTGRYCDAEGAARDAELARLVDASAYGAEIGLDIHAGHGLTYDTVGPVAAIGEIEELNIGHFLIGEAIFSGLDSAVRRMRALMDQARALSAGQRSA